MEGIRGALKSPPRIGWPSVNKEFFNTLADKEALLTVRDIDIFYDHLDAANHTLLKQETPIWICNGMHTHPWHFSRYKNRDSL